MSSRTAVTVAGLTLMCCGGPGDSSPAPGGPSGPAASAGPIGVPAPPFGIAERAGTATHYVDNTSLLATDDANPNGAPERPRRTIPALLAAGSVVEVRGGPYVIDTPGGQNTLALEGTATSPVFVRGVGGPLFTSPPGKIRQLRVAGTYFVLEGLVLEGMNVALVGSHVALRSSEVRGYDPGRNGAAVTGDGSNIVIAGNHIHNNGDPASPVEHDVHGVKFSEGSAFIWILENHIHHNGGDSVQMGDERSDEPWIRNVYIGGNVLHDDRENCVDIKQSRDVVVSQNECYGYQTVTSSDGTAIVVHYGPERVWVLANRLHDASGGVRYSASDGRGQVHIVGNVIYRIHHRPGSRYDPNHLYSLGTGIMTWEAAEVEVVSNTIYDADAGITYPGDETEARVRIVNNLVSRIAQATHHVGVKGPYRTASLSHTLMHGPARIKWGASAPVYDVASFSRAFPEQCEGCTEADPLFVDRAAFDLHLQSSSPAVEAGTVDRVYETFRSLYGIDISRDADGRPRPQGARWDIGAYEYSGQR